MLVSCLSLSMVLCGSLNADLAISASWSMIRSMRRFLLNGCGGDVQIYDLSCTLGRRMIELRDELPGGKSKLMLDISLMKGQTFWPSLGAKGTYSGLADIQRWTAALRG